MKTYSNKQVSYTPIQVEWEGKQYLKVPVVMMVEGVHNGQFHSAEQLGAIEAAWNGIPVTLSHPKENGEFISANTPNVLMEWAVGRVFNTHMDGNKLKAEAFLDIEKLENVSPSTLENVRNGKIIEVSVGVFQDSIEEEGEWNGEQYNIVAVNLRPDHLALLPDEIGACSVKDGCGVRVNSKITESLTKKKGVCDVSKKQDLSSVIIHPFELSVNEMSLGELLDRVTRAVYANDSNTEGYYVQEVFENSVIYSVRNYETGEYTMYKRAYQVNADGNVELVGDPQKVIKKVEYELVTNKEKKMCEKCKEKATALIANERTHFTENDRSWLEGLPEDKLDLLIPKQVSVNVTAVTIEDAWKVVKEKAKVEDYLENIPEDAVKKLVANQKEKDEKTELIQKIVANSDMTEEELTPMSFSILQKLSASFEGGGNYSIRVNTGGGNGNPGIAPMPLTGMKFGK